MGHESGSSSPSPGHGLLIGSAFLGIRKNTSSLPSKTIGLSTVEPHPDSLGLCPAPSWRSAQPPLAGALIGGKGEAAESNEMEECL